MSSMIRLVAENPVFHTLQGEGDYMGIPTTFVRTAGCNLRCTRKDGVGWSCDTPTSLPDFDTKLKVLRPTPTRFAHEYDATEICKMIMQHRPTHLAITGGEPTIQDEVLAVLLAYVEHEALLVGRRPHVTLETNGTKFSAVLARRIDLVSLSPKVYQPATIAFAPLKEWATTARRVQVKIVMADLNPEARDMAVSVFQTVRALRAEASLYVQRADVGDEHTDRVQQDMVVSWVKDDLLLRSLGVRYGLQAHKLFGVP